MTRRTLLTTSSLALAGALASDAQANTADVTPETVYELRIYHLNPGKLPLIPDRFRNHEVKIFERLGMHPVAFFTPVQPPEADDRPGAFPPETLIYILRHKSLAAARAAWAAFGADPEWIALKAKTEKDGAFVSRHEDTFIQRTDFSPAI
jgi:hypothetical protein